jgi:TetR/AcrR family transcriptional regulator, regulator of mycofactocin system
MTAFQGNLHDREARRARERLRIEKAALLLARGFDAVTADDIAEAAAISRRTFFRYFPSRDEVLCGVYIRALLHLFELMRARPIEEPLIEALVNAARLDMLPSTDPDELEIAGLTRRLMARDGDAWQRAVWPAQGAILGNYTGVVSFRLAAAGRDPSGARLIAASLWAVSCDVFFQWLGSPDRSSLPDLLLAGLQTVRDALAHEPRPAG